MLLGALALGGCGAAVWLALGRARLVAEAAAARATAETAEVGRVQDRAERERTEGRLREVGETLMRVGADRARLEQELHGEREAHRVSRETLARERETALKKLEERLRAEVDHAAEVGRERLESVRREKQAIQEQLEAFEKKLREAFGSLAAEALKSNQQQFLALAEQKLDAKKGAVEQLVKPIAETLARTDQKLAVIEAAGVELKSETGRLVKALREPHVRGRYGEVQLRRVAELAGMTAYCDFCEQEQTRDADGNPLRPDMVVRLPNSRSVVVDAKTNIQAYMDAVGAASPEEQERHLDRFARHVAEQATALARKKYWALYDGSPEFVVMFIPGDQFVDAALGRQPEILERAAEQGVILASPSTLIGLLRAVAVGYKEQQLAKAAEELRELGKELHERVATAMEHASRLGRHMNSAVEAFNAFVGSYQSRLEPAMRRFEEGGVKSGKSLPKMDEVDSRARSVAGVPGPIPVLGAVVKDGVRDGLHDGLLLPGGVDGMKS